MPMLFSLNERPDTEDEGARRIVRIALDMLTTGRAPAEPAAVAFLDSTLWEMLAHADPEELDRI
jgi:hypothetical protein